MISIGMLSKHTGVKVPTIRYYEQLGLIDEPERSRGNQRRYGQKDLDRLAFIKHARDLGFSIQSIISLIHLHTHPDQSCQEAGDIAKAQLQDVQTKIERLCKLETELKRIAHGCNGTGVTGECYVLASLSDHALCGEDHAK